MNRDDLDDRDDPQPEDIEDLDGDDAPDEDIRRCPACGQTAYWGAPKCPRCGEWFTNQAEGSARVPGWLWPAVVALLIAIILVMWIGLGR